jgi:hypothetical protein
MGLEKEVIENNQAETYKQEVFKAIENLPRQTINPNGKKIPVTKIIPTNYFYIGLENPSQLNIPEDARYIKEHKKPHSKEFQYQGLKYFIGFDS